MVKTTTIELISKKEFELIRITKDILKAVEESGVKNGVVYAITAHTTTGILVNESLACLEVDIEQKLEEYERQGWAERHDRRWNLTPKGFLVSNQLIGDLMAVQEAGTLEKTLPRLRAEGKLRKQQ